MRDEDPIKYPVDGTLDLHMFDPSEAKDLVREYLSECRAAGILDVRVVHGKGTGTMREIVHSTLRSIDFVEDFSLAPAGGGSWGATLVRLRPLD